MVTGAGTVYLDQGERACPELDGVQELLPLGRLLKEYDLNFEFGGRSAPLRHQQTRELVGV